MLAYTLTPPTFQSTSNAPSTRGRPSSRSFSRAIPKTLRTSGVAGCLPGGEFRMTDFLREFVGGAMRLPWWGLRAESERAI